MNNEEKKYLEALKGISYVEWLRVSRPIDLVFGHKKTEQEKNLKLDEIDNIENFIANLW